MRKRKQRWMEGLRAELESVQAQLKELRKVRFGKSSEKRKTSKMLTRARQERGGTF